MDVRWNQIIISLHCKEHLNLQVIIKLEGLLVLQHSQEIIIKLVVINILLTIHMMGGWGDEDISLWFFIVLIRFYDSYDRGWNDIRCTSLTFLCLYSLRGQLVGAWALMRVCVVQSTYVWKAAQGVSQACSMQKGRSGLHCWKCKWSSFPLVQPG
jgi:hypothetical protein